MHFLSSYEVRRAPKRGFTFLEVLIAIGILGILGALAVPPFLNFYLRNQLELQAKEITLALRATQSRAISRESESYWGIHFVNAVSGSDYFEIFRNISTPAYASAQIVSTSYFPAGVALVSPASGATQDVIFSQVSGAVSGGSVTLVLSLARDAATTKTITVSAGGLISFLYVPEIFRALFS